MAKMQMIFYGELRNKEFTINNRDRFLKYVAKMADVKNPDKPVRIKMTVEKVYKQKSQKMLGYYFGVVVAMIAEELGYSPWERQEVHAALKKEVIGNVGDDRLPLTPSIKKMNTLEFGEYIDNCRRWAAQFLNINIPDPTQIQPDEYNQQFMH